MIQYLPPIAYSVVFLSSVYFDKALRPKHSLSKLTSRLIAVTTTTLICMIHCKYTSCEGLSTAECFYLEPTFWPVVKTLIANTILFSTHIATSLTFEHQPSFKSIIAAPILEELLFRGTFFRASHEHVSLSYLALVFSISHSHKLLYKILRGKKYYIQPYIGQMIFTFVFSLYCLYILKSTHRLVASMALHAYCNLLGPPRITPQNFKWHLVSITGFFVFMVFMF